MSYDIFLDATIGGIDQILMLVTSAFYKWPRAPSIVHPSLIDQPHFLERCPIGGLLSNLAGVRTLQNETIVFGNV